MTWWRDGVLYQVYPRSFADSDGDGHGDLRGLIDRLDHLAWLGVAGIWLNPTFPSPNDDWGYDVSDYRGVHPDFGTLEEMDVLIAAARRAGHPRPARPVPNHSSDRHPWFTEHPDYYTWAERPNNWKSIFDGGPAWTERDHRYYLHLFLPTQPDLNWWNPAVGDEFDAILRFWLDRGVAGFRIDVCQAIVKDRELRDDPGRSENQPEVHDVMRRWRAVADGYEDAMLVGETYVYDLDALVRYYGDGSDELHLGFNIPFIKAPLEAEPMREIVEYMERELPDGAWPVWTGSNHDAGRLATRWAEGDPDRARCALVMLLTLRGTPFLYYGDELGLTDGPVDRPPRQGRRPRRLPHPDAVGEPGGLDPWFARAVAAAACADGRGDAAGGPGLDAPVGPGADRIAAGVRAASRTRRYRHPSGVWAYRRGRHVIVLNLAADPVSVELSGDLLLGTRTRDGFDGSLAGHEAVVLHFSSRLRCGSPCRPFRSSCVGELRFRLPAHRRVVRLQSCAAAPGAQPPTDALRRRSGEVLRYEDVVGAAGYASEREPGVKVIELDSVVGTVDRTRDFDRAFRPTSGRTRARWERIAAAYRSGESLPPIHVRRIGDMHFVVDGHHRVSAARALGLDQPRRARDRGAHPRGALDIGVRGPHPQAPVRRAGATTGRGARAHHAEGRGGLRALAEGVEAWAFRHGLTTREDAAHRWYADYYQPVVELLRDADLVGDDGETAAFIRLETQRYLLLRSHAMPDDAMVERLRRDL